MGSAVDPVDVRGAMQRWQLRATLSVAAHRVFLPQTMVEPHKQY
jgi:hypothetical protein